MALAIVITQRLDSPGNPSRSSQQSQDRRFETKVNEGELPRRSMFRPARSGAETKTRARGVKRRGQGQGGLCRSMPAPLVLTGMTEPGCRGRSHRRQVGIKARSIIISTVFRFIRQRCSTSHERIGHPWHGYSSSVCFKKSVQIGRCERVPPFEETPAHRPG